MTNTNTTTNIAFHSRNDLDAMCESRKEAEKISWALRNESIDQDNNNLLKDLIQKP